jgi:hypothetical protein
MATEAKDALVEAGLSEDMAKTVVKKIYEGLIPHVSIQYNGHTYGAIK